MLNRFHSTLVAVVLATSTAGVAPARAAPGAARVLYQATWSHGLAGWQHSSTGWTIQKGAVRYDGGSASVLVAPYKVSTTRYTIEASLRLLRWRQTGISESHGLGILLRARGVVDPTGDTAGLMAGIGRGFVGCSGLFSQPVIATADTDLTDLAQDAKSFPSGQSWHAYRVDVSANTIALYIDGRLRTTVTTKQFAGAPSVGLFSLSTGMEARSFRISSH